MRRAVIDVGSGSVVTLVSQNLGDGWTDVASKSEGTLLSEDLLTTGTLREDRMRETLAALARGFAFAAEHGAAATLAIGTMALRRASNASEFLEAAAEQGTPVRVISGEREAELGFLAVVTAPRFAEMSCLSILDVGGQSTEFTIAERNGATWSRRFSHSFPTGTLQLRSQFLKEQSPDGGHILNAAAWLDDLIGVEIPPADTGPMVQLGAPGTDLITLREGLTTWQPAKVDGAYLDYEEVGKAVGWLMRMDDASRQALPGLEQGRGKTIHAGCLILERFLNAINASGCTVTIRGWRHAAIDLEFASPI